MTELEKLKHLLEHWIEHNDAHIQTYKEWAAKADTLGEKELAEILGRIADESRGLETLFNKAIQIIK
ncbi:MAG: hypothetical protein AB1499_07630 [Nitrospirota bacterium]